MLTKEMIDKFSLKENNHIAEVNEELCKALLESEGFHKNCAPVIASIARKEPTKEFAITMMAVAIALVQYGYELRKLEETYVEEEVTSAN